MYTATYSPDDNKLRLYAVSRLDAETYARVKTAGFSWAPKQGLFFAVWGPAREDLLIELACEIGDDDATLIDRAEERAERFEDYSDRRAADAESARKAVSAIADNIPFGQPILVGHHSERHARKDAERIENGMRRAVKAFDTSRYWTDRAASAIRHAKYKERADVRARRIKTIEAEQRKVERSKSDSENAVRIWSKIHDDSSMRRKDGEPSTFAERALYVAGHTNTAPWNVYSDLTGGKITPQEAQEQTLNAAGVSVAHCDRWLAHFANRLAYERAMLADAGGIVADRTGPEVGGGCRCWASPRGGWSYIRKVNKVSVTVEDNWGNGGANFTRTIPFDKLAAIMPRAEVDAANTAGNLVETTDKTGFYLRDSSPDRTTPRKPDATPTEFDAMRESLAAGVQVISAAQLFPTPPELVARMVEIAGIEPGMRVLEPSAGTGAILDQLPYGCTVVAVEVNPTLGGRLNAIGHAVVVSDFLKCSPETLSGPFDRVIMNPPFVNGVDIEHITRALGFLKPGGRLVAVCANGPRQRERLMPIIEQCGGDWEDLPPDTFKVSGTSVNAALITCFA